MSPSCDLAVVKGVLATARLPPKEGFLAPEETGWKKGESWWHLVLRGESWAALGADKKVRNWGVGEEPLGVYNILTHKGENCSGWGHIPVSFGDRACCNSASIFIYGPWEWLLMSWSWRSHPRAKSNVIHLTLQETGRGGRMKVPTWSRRVWLKAKWVKLR